MLLDNKQKTSLCASPALLKAKGYDDREPIASGGTCQVGFG